MKRLIKMFSITLVFSVVCSQLILLAADLLGIKEARQRSVPALIYLACVAVSGMLLVVRGHQPRAPFIRLRRVLETEGYTHKYYAMLMRWHDLCIKRGYPQVARLVLAESLIDGGHTLEGLEVLEKLNVDKLERVNKQIYYNTLLYAAVINGEREAADRIYESARPWLYTVTGRHIAASVRHTLGCYEYLRGDAEKAELLFMQALDSDPGSDVICEIRLALTLCYLDSGRYDMAKSSADIAAHYANTVPLRQKLENTRTLAEGVFRAKRASIA